MAGGRHIEDHKFWAGKKEDGVVFPKGAHLKSEHSDGHEGHLSHYEDTTETIMHQQEMGVKKAKGHSQKPGFRN